MELETFIRSEIPGMAVIFRHKAGIFKIDNQIRYDAVYIKDPDLSDIDTATAFYKNEIHRASNAGKSFIVMNFNTTIADYFNALLSKTDNCNYKNWIFLAFFNDDDITQTEKKLEEKNSILLSMQDYHFIKKFSIPKNANLTFRAVLPIILETWGYNL
jgi:hypothetical protein